MCYGAPINSTLLIERFFNCKCNPNHKVLYHITTYCYMAEELRNAHPPVSELQLTVKIIVTLPPSFWSFCSTWYGLPLDQQTVIKLTPRLVSEESITRFFYTERTDPADAAVFASLRPTPTTGLGAEVSPHNPIIPIAPKFTANSYG